MSFYQGLSASQTEQSPSDNFVVSFRLQIEKLGEEQIKYVKCSCPIFNVKIEDTFKETTTDRISLKVKLKSRNNPNYIKLLGAANIPIEGFLNQYPEERFFDLFGLKDGKPSSEDLSEQSIGKILIKSEFIQKIESARQYSLDK